MSILPHDSHDISGSGYCGVWAEATADREDLGRRSLRGGTSGEDNAAAERSLGVEGELAEEGEFDAD